MKIEQEREKVNDQETILTWEMVHMCETPYGGFTQATIEALGIKWPPKRGWVRKLIGKKMTKEEFGKAVQGKFQRRTVPKFYRNGTKVNR